MCMSAFFTLPHQKNKKYFLKFYLLPLTSLISHGWCQVGGSRHVRCRKHLALTRKRPASLPDLKSHWLLMTWDHQEWKSMYLPQAGSSPITSLQRCTAVCFLGPVLHETVKIKITFLSLTSSLLTLIHFSSDPILMAAAFKWFTTIETVTCFIGKYIMTTSKLCENFDLHLHQFVEILAPKLMHELKDKVENYQNSKASNDGIIYHIQLFLISFFSLLCSLISR